MIDVGQLRTCPCNNIGLIMSGYAETSVRCDLVGAMSSMRLSICKGVGCLNLECTLGLVAGGG